MQKKVLVVALAGAFAAPFAAQAADGNVTIYARLWTSFTGSASKGAADPRNVNSFITSQTIASAPEKNLTYRHQVTCSSCQLGFKGSEDLGGGLSAWFQLESTINVDGEAGPIGSVFGNRNSGVGLTHKNWGTVMLGQWDTPYKTMSLTIGVPFFGTTVGSYNGIIGTPGFGVGSFTTSTALNNINDQASFDRRQRNIVQYWSPKWNGFSARAAFGANETKTTQTGSTPGLNTRLYSGSIQYSGFNIDAGVSFEYHRDSRGLQVMQTGGSFLRAGGVFPTLNPVGVNGNANTFADSRDWGVKAQASYKIQGKYRVGGIFEHLQYESDRTISGPGVLDRYDRNAYGVYTILPIGPGDLQGNVLFSDKANCSLAGGGSCNAGGTQAWLFSAAYFYHLSKRTDIILQYAQVENKDGNHFLLGGGPLEKLGGGFGADPYAWSLGMRHSF